MFVIVSNDKDFNGTVFEFSDDSDENYLIVSTRSKKIVVGDTYSLSELKILFNEFTYKELLLD